MTETTTRTAADVTDDELRTYQRSTQYRGLLAELLQDSVEAVAKAQVAMNEAESRRRVNALIAVRAGLPKTQIANALGVSRPTLDAWLADASDDEDEAQAVVQHEYIERRSIARGQVRFD